MMFMRLPCNHCARDSGSCRIVNNTIDLSGQILGMQNSRK